MARRGKRKRIGAGGLRVSSATQSSAQINNLISVYLQLASEIRRFAYTPSNFPLVQQLTTQLNTAGQTLSNFAMADPTIQAKLQDVFNRARQILGA